MTFFMSSPRGSSPTITGVARRSPDGPRGAWRGAWSYMWLLGWAIGATSGGVLCIVVCGAQVALAVSLVAFVLTLTAWGLGRHVTSGISWTLPQASLAVVLTTIALYGWYASAGAGALAGGALLLVSAPAVAALLGRVKVRGSWLVLRPRHPGQASVAKERPAAGVEGADGAAEPPARHDLPQPVLPSADQVQQLNDEDLCRAWRVSFVVLERLRSLAAADTARQGDVAMLRQCYLDELERRDPSGFRRWLGSGPRPAGDPSRYLTHLHLDTD